MHDLGVIKRMNEEATDDSLKVGERVTVITESGYHDGDTGTISYIDSDRYRYGVQVTFPDGDVGWFEHAEISRGRTPKQIAQKILDDHCIYDHFIRNGEQIRELLIEAVREAQK